jgi:hypothetical protein
VTLLEAVAGLVRAETGRSPRWEDLVVQLNYGPVPSPSPGDDSVWNRGFNFLVLGAAGPTHFGRCRSGADARAERASAIRAHLGDAVALGGAVPRTRLVNTGALLVELSAYVPGTPWEVAVTRQDAAAWSTNARRILALVRQAGELAARDLPALVAPVPGVDLRASSAGTLRALRGMGLDANRCDALDAALGRGGSVPGRVQHGDLWPGNILQAGGDFVLLDFEVFGDVRMPLYDDLHLLRSIQLMRRPAPVTLLGALRHDDTDAGAFRVLLSEAAARDGATGPAVVAMLAWYLGDFAAKVRGRGAEDPFWQPFWRCLEDLADRLIAGDAVDRLLLGA